MKTFYEWLGDSNLLNELSPDLLHRASDEAKTRSIERRGDLLNKERADRFKAAAYDRYKFDINVIQVGGTKPESYSVLMIKNMADKKFLLRTSTSATDDFMLDMDRHTLMRNGVTPYVLDTMSARRLMSRLSEEFGDTYSIADFPRMNRSQEALGLGAAERQPAPASSDKTSWPGFRDPGKDKGFGLVS